MGVKGEDAHDRFPRQRGHVVAARVVGVDPVQHAADFAEMARLPVSRDDHDARRDDGHRALTF